MNDYFEGTTGQLKKRARLLLRKIPRNLPREFHLLEQRCRDRIHQVLSDLKGNSNIQLSAVRLRALRRAVHELDYLETVGIAALNRVDLEEDVWLNELILRITQEIAYPLLPPVVTSLSHSYFQIYTNLNLLRVPLAEGSFLLHLPDLYHELAHLLTIYPNDPRVEPLQFELLKTLDVVWLHYVEEEEKLDRKGAYEEFKFYMRLWSECWWQFWGFEFFCDLFSIYTVGPAFAWSHYHLSAKRGADPFEVPTRRFLQHPADGARMQAMLCALKKVGFAREAQIIKQQWNELVTTSGFHPQPEYYRCYPNHLIELLVQHSFVGTQAIGCTIAEPDATGAMFGLLNSAWSQFWKDPQNYSVWEQQVVDSLRHRREGFLQADKSLPLPSSRSSLSLYDPTTAPCSPVSSEQDAAAGGESQN